MITAEHFEGAARDEILKEQEAASKSEKVVKMPAAWHRSLIRDSRGGVRPLLANAITALSEAPEWERVLAFNEFAVKVQTKRASPWGKPAGEQWGDNDDRRTAEWLQRQGLFVGTNLAGEAVQTVAAASRFHPVREYLNSLKWDGKPRLDTWCGAYLGTTKEIACTFGRLWLISAVARILKPGTKADCCLVLEGPQGIYKSTALRTLAGEWFTDQISDLGSKDAAMQSHGVWIVEIAELDSINRSESSRIKGFMSATFDRFRLPYGKNIIEWPRDCVFAGTVNHDAYLRDETGARRFWPVRCGAIDIKALARDRDQLWAEAIAEFRAGASWWLKDQDSIEQAEAEQGERYQEGPWDSPIEAWLQNPGARYDVQGHPVADLDSDTTSVTVADILSHCIGKEPKHWTKGDQMAVGATLKRLGWERFRRRDGNKLQWRYQKTGVVG
ncbi:MAG: virulence-associated family protein [Bryobacterales bacterium]|nr:virulence-associated family protein [Bryobacterales bacterium]